MGWPGCDPFTPDEGSVHLVPPRLVGLVGGWPHWGQSRQVRPGCHPVVEPLPTGVYRARQPSYLPHRVATVPLGARKGLKEAIARCFAGASWQPRRCRFCFGCVSRRVPAARRPLPRSGAVRGAAAVAAVASVSRRGISDEETSLQVAPHRRPRRAGPLAVEDPHAVPSSLGRSAQEWFEQRDSLLHRHTVEIELIRLHSLAFSVGTRSMTLHRERYRRRGHICRQRVGWNVERYNMRGHLRPHAPTAKSIVSTRSTDVRRVRSGAEECALMDAASPCHAYATG